MKRFAHIALASFGALVLGSNALASVYFEFNSVISGSPDGGPVYATLLIEDAGTDTVNFTMTNAANPVNAAGQYVSKLLLNVDPYVSGTMTWSSPKITGYSFSEDGENDSGARFDYRVDFENANNGNRFLPGDVVTWSVTGSGLSETSFQALSAGNAQYEGMIHVQAIPSNGGSAKIVPGEPVPEPASLIALTFGGLALLNRRRKA